jgi:hypothetical protein
MPRRKEPHIPDAILDQLLAGVDPKTAFEPNGLIDDLKKALAERVLNAEMDHHLSSPTAGGSIWQFRLGSTQLRASTKSAIAAAIRYGLNHWDGLAHFLEDGRIEIDTITVERSMSPIALNRKNASPATTPEPRTGPFASLIETCKLNTEQR